MRTIAHLSDLRFGRGDGALAEPLVAAIKELRPDLVVVSGGLTERGRPGQFRQARRFLDALPFPRIVVAGKRDASLYRTAAHPFDNFQKLIANDLDPFYADEEIAVSGLRDARAKARANRRISEGQIARLRLRLCSAGEEAIKIIATHNPFASLDEGEPEADLAGGSQSVMEALRACGADLLLAGDQRLRRAAQTAESRLVAGRNTLILSASTYASARRRGEASSFNVIRALRPHLKIERYAWQPERQRFLLAAGETFRRATEGWTRLTDEVAAGITFAEGSAGLQPTIPEATR